MARYGNILTIFNPTPGIDIQIKAILTNRNADFEVKENTFFVETISKVNTREIIDDIALLPAIEFAWFHNHLSTGSSIKSAGLDQPFVDRINALMLE